MINAPAPQSAHDVRHLRPCVVCDGLGDKRNMIPYPVHAEEDEPSEGLFHGQCFVKKYGMQLLLAQPFMVLNSLTIGDVGSKVMIAIMAMYDALSPRERKWLADARKAAPRS